jgi:putative ABC transport system permease protein
MGIGVAIRSLLRTPGFTLLIILVLALGIGANTAIFSVVNGVLLRPLQFHESDRIVTLTSAWKGRGRFGQVSGPDFQDWHDQSTAFSAMARYQGDETSVLAGNLPEYTSTAVVSNEFFSAMGATASLGRLLTEADHQKGAPAVAVVSDAFWRRHFAGQTPDGRQTVRAVNIVFPIVGVLPPGFRFPGATDLWVPITSVDPDLGSRSGHNYRVVGRLKPGISLEQAQAQMTTIAARLEQGYPESNKNKSSAVTLLLDYTVRNMRLSLYVLLGAVALVLLIACANVANLLLAKAAARTREVAIRAALGASRGQVIRQLLTESCLLAAAAGGLGLLLANWGVAALVALAPKGLPRLDEASIDPTVLAFTIGLSAIASLLFGLAPAWRVSRTDPADALRQGSARGVVGGFGSRLRQSFVVGEIALCVVLLISAGLLLRSLSSLLNVDLGFQTENVLTAEISPTDAGSGNERQVTESFYRQVKARAAELPQVQAAALTHNFPGQSASNGSYIVDGQDMKDFTVNSPQAGFTIASTGYFQALGMRIVAGRDFNDSDTFDGTRVAVLSESLARAAYPNRDPLGHQIMCGYDQYSAKWMTIIGVVKDGHMDGPARPVTAELYMPALQHPNSEFTLLVKTASPPEQQMEPVRRLVHDLNPQAAVRFNTLSGQMSDVIAAPRFTSVLLSSFAGLAFALALIGIYAVMSYIVVQRSAEVGLRMALGAERMSVLRMILSEALGLAVVGSVIGLMGAVAATRLLSSLLFNVKPADPLTYGFAILLLIGAALLASFLPAWRASRVEPLEALRQE